MQLDDPMEALLDALLAAERANWVANLAKEDDILPALL